MHLRRPDGGLKKTDYDAVQVINTMYRLMNVLSEKTGRRLDLDVLKDCNYWIILFLAE